MGLFSGCNARHGESVLVQILRPNRQTVTHKSEVRITDLAHMVKLTRSERTALQHQAEVLNDRSDAARHARLILLLDEGLTWAEIRDRLDCSDSYIARWSKRFAAERLAGLYARHAGRERYKVTDRLETRVLKRTTQHTPADGSRHWSSRKLADELGGAISHMTVARIWAKHGIKPHRLESCLTSSDPAFDAGAADVIGLYLNRPQHAAVFSVCTVAMPAAEQLPASQHIEPTPALRNRHGTRALYATLKTRNDEPPGKSSTRHTSAEFAAFLADIAAHQPNGKTTHVIADNLPTRKARALTELVANHPDVHVHFTSTYASWLNQLERCLGEIERNLSARGATPPADLKRKLMRYIRRGNQRPRPVKWKYVEPGQGAPGCPRAAASISER